jgi:nucleotide-binding universal stress UspA family protein
MKDYSVKNILVPIDFSAISRHALHHARRIGELTHARITLLHVIEPYIDSIGGDAGVIAALTELVQEMESQRSKDLQKISRAMMKRSGVKVRTMVMIGAIASTIGKKAAETRADLIIMGTHGASGFIENLMGSNTYRVATLSRIPVLSVHKPMGRNGYSDIVYPVRSNVRVMGKFAHALMFAKLFKARVHVIGLLQPGKRTPEKNIHALCAVITSRFANYGVEAKTVFLSTPQLAEAVIRYVREYSGSLVVMNQDSDFRLVELFQGTFPKRILHKVLSPVLTVPT